MSLISCSAKGHVHLKAENYIVSSERDAASVTLSNLAYKTLREHVKKPYIITLINLDQSKAKNNKIIHFEVNPNIDNDYCINHIDEKLSITIKNKNNSVWIISQLLEELSKVDSRFKTDDFPPSTISFSTKCIDFDFSYREPHFPSNLILGNSLIYGNNNVDLDWGIWGHNLKKVMKNISDTNIYARVDNVRTQDQFCFGSPELREYLNQYILSNFGEGEVKDYHFMIMPQDNNLVCMCDKCKALGNTKSSATPAVINFINKIADEFPKHHFFTSSYITTNEPPKEKMSKNTGVFLSTIKLKKGVELNLEQPNTAKFVNKLETWKEITSNTYIWDYSANFDDYLTPIPILYSLQKQLNFYKELGLKGVFINSSGYDYTSFGDVKSFVAGALLKNTNENIDVLCASYFNKFYPKNHQLLTDYYLQLEKSFSKKNKSYALYGGIKEVLSSYLDTNAFLNFYNELGDAIKLTSKEEKEKLKKLYTALTYTKLQIAYYQVTGENGCADILNNKLVIKPEINNTIGELENYVNYSNLNNYKEAKGAIGNYINFWKDYILKQNLENLILNEKIEVLSTPNEGFENTKYLNDGLPGYDNDYHQGWYISSEDLKVQFSTEKIDGLKNIKFNFLNSSRHSFYPPQEIAVWLDDKLIETVLISEPDMNANSLEFNLSLDIGDAKKIQLILTQRPIEKSKIAIDEIRVLN